MDSNKLKSLTTNRQPKYSMIRIRFSCFLFVVTSLLYSCTFNQTVKTQITFPAGVNVDTIPFKYTDKGHISLRVNIKGKDYDFMFDSGAQITTLGPDVPVLHTVSDSAVIFDVIDERFHASAVILDTLRIGQLGITKLGVLFQTEMPLDGILGGDVLRNLAWKIDFARREIYVAKKAEDLGVDANERGIYFRLRKNKPTISYRINDIEVRALMDTGDPGFIDIDKNTLEEYADKFENGGVTWYQIFQKLSPFEAYIDEARYLSGSGIDTFSYVKSNINIGSHLLKHEITRLIPSASYSSSFGLDLLQRFDYVVLDYPRRKLFLGRPQYKSAGFLVRMNQRINSMGVELSTDSVPVVIGISELSSDKDIRLKDTIVAIDGVSLLGRSSDFYKDSHFRHDGTGATHKNDSLNTILTLIPSKYTRVLEQFVYRNDTATLSIKRNDKIHQVELVRNDQFTFLPDTVIHIADTHPFPGYIFTKTHTINGEQGRYYLSETRKRPFRPD